MKIHSMTLALTAALLIYSMPQSAAGQSNCRQNHKSMLQTGVVTYRETVIDRSIEEVWAVLPEYYKWSTNHENSKRRHIAGERGKVGEIVEITLRSAKDHPIYAETVRIRSPLSINGLPKAGNMAWKVYDKDVCFSRFSDFGVWEYDGKTVFSHSVYEEISPESDESLVVHADPEVSNPNSRNEAIAALKRTIEEYIDKRERADD
jgi:hypothetical protein